MMLPRKAGYAFLTDRATGKVIKEWDTPRCNHCGKICHPELKATPGDNYGHCTRCDRDICARCATKMERGSMCDVYEEQLKRLEQKLETMLHYSSIV